MSRNARIEEVSDSDSDPPEMDPGDFAPSKSIISPANIPSPSSSSTTTNLPFQPPRPSAQQMAAAREASKHYQCLYPVYFDSTRSKRQGRRVPRSLSTANPLARGIIDALQAPPLLIPASRIVFEPGKLHPKDWANPGRVRVALRDGPGGKGLVTGGRVLGKEELMRRVAEYLVAHPTQEGDPLKLQVRGLRVPEDGNVPVPAVPRGWKMGTVLPLHSPGLSGGGVDEDMFKEMMREMGGAGGAEGNPLAGMLSGMGGLPGMVGGGGGGGKKVVRVGKKGK